MTAAHSALRALREGRHLTQRELARRAGFHETTVCNFERKPPPVWYRLARIADALGCTTDEVLGRVKPRAVLPEVDAKDRLLLAAMEQSAIDLLGPDLLARLGGWRRAALSGWQGKLMGVRDRDLLRPKRPALAARYAIEDQEKRSRRSIAGRGRL